MSFSSDGDSVVARSSASDSCLFEHYSGWKECYWLLIPVSTGSSTGGCIISCVFAFVKSSPGTAFPSVSIMGVPCSSLPLLLFSTTGGVCWVRRRFLIHHSTSAITRSSPATPIPTPIPILAPLLKVEPDECRFRDPELLDLEPVAGVVDVPMVLFVPVEDEVLVCPAAVLACAER